ncbi:ATP-binding protein [Pelotalea chapellei]|uniref:histidine kinase n=1 Tax=Pelotalea chapellei TaxID=44671 RepID=A0ABS5U6H3_9BACT|nr:ATP-binding protein [Pelotalea chapellei]MBT1071254.1 HAMP domain-containing protein [Pelotalea chapellei]
MKFRTKLMLSYLLLILMVSGSFYLFFKRNLQNSLVEESRANLMNQATLARLLVEQERDRIPPQKLAEKIGATIKARVTLISRDGTVIGESDVNQTQLSRLENHLGRPEIQAALKFGQGSAMRYSETLRRNMLYVALDAGGGFVRLALPLDYLAHATEALHNVLGVMALLTIAVAIVLSYVLSNLTSRPLRDIAAAAARIGRGEPGVTISVASSDEIGDLADVLNDMARRIEAQLKRLSTEKQRLDTILHGMGEGVMVTTGDGTISLVNPAFGPLFGIRGSVEGKSLIEISRHPDLQAAFNELRATKGELVREITIPPATTLLTHWTPLVVDGDDQGVVAVFHDISDMKKVETMRRDFVANVSHELRTPVTVIKGYAETLLDGLLESDPQRAKRFVEIIGNHSERLASLITDILTLSHLESKETELDQYPLDVHGTMAKACLLLADSAAGKNIVLKNEGASGVPKVMADQGRLEQVLINLLENAIKYTPEGGTIRLFVKDCGPYVKVSVADTGIGIPFKDMPRIFERFYRVDEARSREQGGTGLGLAIVKHIVQLHGGEVSVASDLGKGSLFSFTLRKAPHALN